ncbi:hypothetical protein A2Y99_03665 [Candidatus Gottesmanbacteria bacterium RBG_13_37_7]|uniref:Prepilin peptidase n=1 Tax=Candidatus Gottesmanbacteria bacterium RBG_13_37_7 TaxID=1798369 RepID=A0A1F5YID2_9BACT|nr:MAG: hypothetical protein A2Y99_03665 [Candidatus Gottesmanbacteria bacterium RBG_13_37_7]
MILLFGLSVGSFINVLVDRIPKGESVVKGRSYCDSCRHQLSWTDLIPLLSFILLSRKCRYCSKKISYQYPLIEVTVGLVFLFTCVAIIQNKIVDYTTMIYIFGVTSALLTIFFIDFKYRIIPDEILIFLILIALLKNIFLGSTTFGNYLVSAVIFFLFFLILFIVTKGKGMGFGDVKFAFAIGLILGFPKVIIAFYLSFLTGALISLILILVGKKKMKSSVAFGPFLSLGCYIALIYGDTLWKFIKAYLKI